MGIVLSIRDKPDKPTTQTIPWKQYHNLTIAEMERMVLLAYPDGEIDADSGDWCITDWAECVYPWDPPGVLRKRSTIVAKVRFSYVG